jgi:hypothetical protein
MTLALRDGAACSDHWCIMTKFNIPPCSGGGKQKIPPAGILKKGYTTIPFSSRRIDSGGDFLLRPALGSAPREGPVRGVVARKTGCGRGLQKMFKPRLSFAMCMVWNLR